MRAADQRPPKKFRKMIVKQIGNDMKPPQILFKSVLHRQTDDCQIIQVGLEALNFEAVILYN